MQLELFFMVEIHKNGQIHLERQNMSWDGLW